MNFANAARWLLATSLTVIVVVDASKNAPLRGSSSIVRDSSGRILESPKSTGCNVQAVSLLQLPDAPEIDDLQFDCEMDPEDANGKSGTVRTLAGPPAKMAALKELLETGALTDGARMDISAHVGKFGNSLILGDNFDPKTAIAKGNKGGQGQGNGRRLQLSRHTGVKSYLVVKVFDVNGVARAESSADISDDIFGTAGDPVNLKSQMEACSFNQITINPANDLGANQATGAPGVTEVTIPIDIKTAATRADVRNAVTTAVQTKLGIPLLPGPYDQVLYVLEACYNDCGWAAYAYINSWNSVYQGVYYKQVGVLVHELGHNYGMAHSGGLDGQTYTDHMGMMGNPLYSDDVGKMCYNAAKNWYLTWYDGNKLQVVPGGGSWFQDVTLVGIADYQNNLSNHPVTIRLETGTSTDYFIGFNRATGVNAQNDEGDDQVAVVQTGNNGESYSQSYLQARMSNGQSYTITNFGGVTGKNIIVEVIDLNIAANPGYATVRFRTDQAPTSSPTKNSFCDPEPGTVRVKVELTTDNYPTETSWTLTNTCGASTVLASGSGYTTANTIQTPYEDCVAPAAFTFRINDSYGDGICCGYGTGSYKVWHGGELVKNGDAPFTSFEETSFGQCGPAPTPPPTTPPPTPAPTTAQPTPPPTPPPTNEPTTLPPTPPPTTPPPTPPPTTAQPTPPPTPPPTNEPTPFPTPPPTQCIADGQSCSEAIEPCCSGEVCPSGGKPSSRVCQPGSGPTPPPVPTPPPTQPSGGPPPACRNKGASCSSSMECCNGTCKGNGTCN